MKDKAKKDAKLHQDQLNKLQRSLTEELEDFWKNKLKLDLKCIIFHCPFIVMLYYIVM